MKQCTLCGKKFGTFDDGPYGTRGEAIKHMTLTHPGIYAPLIQINKSVKMKYS